MKGQYLAIETVLTFAMGISLAIGVISVFNGYKSDLVSTTTEEEVQIVNSEVRNAFFHLKSSDSGSVEIDLPDDISGSEYSVTVDREIRVNVNTRTFKQEIKLDEAGYDFRGTVEGGQVRIYKSGNEFILRSG